MKSSADKREDEQGASKLERVLSLKNVLIFVVVLWLLWAFFLFLPGVAPVSDDIATRALYGDAFGALGVLFSGLAFALLWGSLSLQKEEIREQRFEMKQARKLTEAQYQPYFRPKKAIGGAAAETVEFLLVNKGPGGVEVIEFVELVDRHRAGVQRCVVEELKARTFMPGKSESPHVRCKLAGNRRGEFGIVFRDILTKTRCAICEFDTTLDRHVFSQVAIEDYPFKE